MSASDAALLAQISDRLNRALAALDRIERNQTDPEETRQAIADITASYLLTAQLADVASVQRQQILELVQWMKERMSGDELQAQFDDIQFVTQQLASISQHWRDDLLLMRSDIRRLASLNELALHQMPTDDPDMLPSDIRAILESRRRARQRLNAILGVVLIARERGEAPPDLADELHELAASDASTVAALRQAVGESQGKS